MAERITSHLERHDAGALHKVMDGIDSLPKFRALLQETLPTVTVEHMLNDFAAQIKLQELFGLYGHKTRSDYYSKETPVVILKKEGETDAGRKTIGGTAFIEPRRFRLDDPDHIYYFNQVPQTDPMIIKIGDDRHNFWGLNRVAVTGGTAEKYNYGAQFWQSNDQGVFKGVGIGNSRMSGVQLPRIHGR